MRQALVQSRNERLQRREIHRVRFENHRVLDSSCFVLDLDGAFEDLGVTGTTKQISSHTHTARAVEIEA